MSRRHFPARKAGSTDPATAVSATASDPPPRATKITVAVLGLVVAFAGIEHGLGEILQGPVAPESRVIESWREVSAFDQLGGEPALTVIPNLLISGILAIGVSLAIAVWSVWFADRPHGGLVLIGLSDRPAAGWWWVRAAADRRAGWNHSHRHGQAPDAGSDSG